MTVTKDIVAPKGRDHVVQIQLPQFDLTQYQWLAEVRNGPRSETADVMFELIVALVQGGTDTVTLTVLEEDVEGMGPFDKWYYDLVLHSGPTEDVYPVKGRLSTVSRVSVAP